MDEAYFPTPFPEHKMEPLEWPHCLATIDVSTLNHGIKFCDEDGYDIVPIPMVQVLGGHDEVSVEDVSDVDDMTIKTDSELLYVASDEDSDRSKHRVENVKMLLRQGKGVEVSLKCEKKKRQFCKSHQRLRKESTKRYEAKENKSQDAEDEDGSNPPHLLGKNEYLYYVGAMNTSK